MLAGWQIEEMEATECSRIWEEMNAPDPCEQKLVEAASSLQVAICHLDKAADWIAEAASELQGTPMEHVVDSYIEPLEDAIHALKELRERYGRGVR